MTTRAQRRTLLARLLRRPRVPERIPGSARQGGLYSWRDPRTGQMRHVRVLYPRDRTAAERAA